METTQYLTTDLIELKEYATFGRQSEMDENIYRHIERLRADEQPESVIEVLRFFGRSSLRILGVSFAKYATIADELNVSLSTVKRAVKALKEYDIIDVIPTLKKWGSYGNSRKKSVNIVRVLHVQASLTPQDDTAVKADEATSDNDSTDNMQAEPILHNHSLLSNDNTYGKHIDTSSEISPYVRFKSLIADKKVRNKIYGIWLAHTRYIRNSYGLDLLLNIGISAVLVTFKARGIRSLTGYYNGTLDKMLDKLHYETII